ncbi:MAG: NifB/NifX family molybdenum-iron cluster-binding protein [Desulfobulbus sp.]|nr:NifB/NifX family molybdenum-iron cluster-binding protein [Desulfobulbus sp.]
MNARETGKKIAVTVWGQRVSPVFDSARTLLIAEINGKTLATTSLITFDPERPLELLHLLRAQQVMLIICGAVSEGPAAMIEAAGIQLIPFIAGDVQQVLEHFLKGRALNKSFRMPGCGKNICCRGKIRRGRSIHAGHLPPEKMTVSPVSQLSMSAVVPEEQPADTALDVEE